MGLHNGNSVIQLRRVQALVAEFIGTFFLVLTVVLSGARSKNPLAGIHAPTDIGLTLASMIYAFNHDRTAFNSCSSVIKIIIHELNHQIY